MENVQGLCVVFNSEEGAEPWQAENKMFRPSNVFLFHKLVADLRCKHYCNVLVGLAEQLAGLAVAGKLFVKNVSKMSVCVM